MKTIGRILLAGLSFVAIAPWAWAIDRDDTFKDQNYSYRLWNLCEAEMNMLWFEKSEHEPVTYLRNRIDASTPDKKCEKESDSDFDDGYSASLVAPAGDEAEPNAPLQRNEFRFADTADWQKPAETHWYSLRFKVTGAEGDQIPSSGAIRWITAQWKYKHLGPNKSPLLAQRFDDGILHVTVEDGFCRCMIAKAGSLPNMANAPGSALGEVDPLRCRLNKKGEPATECKPPRLKLYAYSRGDLEQLPDPKKDWVTMTYRVKAGGENDTLYEIYADGRFIVRAKYARQADVPPGNQVKFKFGHYRDRTTTAADMLVARVCVSPNAERCDRSVRPAEGE
ncbi:heparin lyase I family protein [Taklimakanibacter deserti]|uniref:heparin lyase I family protein n=1 Tax=Taklimakanibacter deserti TaxID=2267839 RepID=UPI0013C45B5C